jgi:4-hydroxy-2-oxoheptanedioate aldolase
MRENKLKQLWQEGKTALNAWLTIPNAWTAETMAHVGFDAITIDMQHGLADYQTAVSMLQAISTTDAVPLARVPWNEPVTIMRLLDAGVYGLVCPMINSREEAEAFVGACRYPPLGFRSYGPIRANVYAGDDYFEHANQTVITLAMIETAQAMENLEEIVSTPGLDGVYVGTVDLSISMGLAGLGDLDDPQLQHALNRIMTQIVKHNRVAGIHASSPEDAESLSAQGFRLITAVNDTNLLRNAAKNALAQTRRIIL